MGMSATVGDSDPLGYGMDPPIAYGCAERQHRSVSVSPFLPALAGQGDQHPHAVPMPTGSEEHGHVNECGLRLF